MLTGTTGSATQIFGERIDLVFATIADAARTGGNAAQQGTHAAGAAGSFTPANLMWLGALLLLLGTVGVLVTAVGSSLPEANTRTALVADHLVQHTRWTATTAFATGPRPTLTEAAEILRDRGATRLVIAPWFLAHGRLTDRVAEFARAQGIPMAAPLGPHRLVADTVLDRFDEAIAARAAA